MVEYIFFKKKLDPKMKLFYDSKIKEGQVIYGMADKKRKKVFVNLPVIKKFSHLYKNTTHENLHLLTSKGKDEKSVRKMIKHIF